MGESENPESSNQSSVPGEIPSAALDQAGQETPIVLVPVAREDFDRRKRRIVWTVVLAVSLAVAAGAWFYKKSVDPIHAQEAYDAAERLMRTARYEQAILSLNQAVALKSDFAEAFLLRGRAKMGVAKPAEAIPDFTQVIALHPNDPQGFIERGSAQIEIEEYDKALADFDQAVALKPDLAQGYNLRGVALRRKGDLAAALEALNRAVSIEPNMNDYFERAATLQLLERHQEAIEDLTRVIEFEPQSGQAYFARSKSYRALGDDASADRDHHTGRVLDGR